MFRPIYYHYHYSAGSWIGHMIVGSVIHAAVWRIMYRLGMGPMVAVAGAVVLLFLLFSRRRR